MSPFRALATAHLQGSWNRLRKQSSVGGLWAFFLLLGVLLVTLVAPLYFGLGAAGYVVGATLGTPDGPRAVVFASLGFTALTLFSGLIGGLSSGSRQLPWETLSVFPVRSGTLFAAELFAGALETITLVELGALLVAGVGLSIGAPAALPLVAALVVSHALVLLALQQLVGSLAQRLTRRFRLVLMLLPVGAVVMSSLAPELARRLNRGAFVRWSERLDGLAAPLPARLLLDAADALLTGRATAAQLALALAVTVGACALVSLAAWRFVSREKSTELETDAGAAAKTWTFDSQVLGIARLQWESLAQSLPGRFGLMMPLVTIVLIRGPLAEVIGRGWTAPLAFGYASLAGTNLLFNQFGLDRHGVKVLFLLPIEPRALLRGKLLGFAAWQALQAALLLGLLVLTGHRDVHELLIGLVLYACIFLVLAMVGQFASIWQPRPLRKNGLRASQPPFMVVMLTFGTLALASALLYGTVYGVRLFAPGWELPILLVIGAGLFVLTIPVGAFNVLLLERQRERLVEVLGASA